MKPPENWTQVIDRKRYSTQTATLIASDAYWNGQNMEQDGSNTFLYRTPNGAFFTVLLTMWDGERDVLRPIDETGAVEMYETVLREHAVEYDVAFPDVEVVDA